jgi:uncharacterized membrane protein YhaH (DUF805 family)
MNWGHYLFGFSGRLNRAKYWLWVLLYLIVTIIVTAIIYFINSPLAGGIVQLAFSIVALVSSLAVMTRRLHDRNKSAWWLLIYVLLPSILLGIGVGTTFYGAMSWLDRHDPLAAGCRHLRMGVRGYRLPAGHRRSQPVRARSARGKNLAAQRVDAPGIGR